MSHYISSFLIDQVVRQARRFSRPSSTGLEPSRTTAPPSTVNGADQHLALRTPSFSLPAFPGSNKAVSSTSLPTFPTEHTPGRGNDGSLQLVEIENLEPAIAARQYAVRLVHEGQASPRQPVPGLERPDNSAAELSVPQEIAIPVVVEGPSPQTVSYDMRSGLQDGPLGPANSGLLEDDGMGQMRRRILAIQRADSSNDVKARLIYDVMTEKHHASHQALHSCARSPASIQSSRRPSTPSSPKTIVSLQPTTSLPTSSSSANDGSNPFQLTPEDLKPTYWKKLPEGQEALNASHGASESTDDSDALGCEHYKRNIKLQCSACNRWYTCRFCHDAVEDHMLNRRETKRMLCVLCGCAQPAGEQCVLCGRSSAWYYCNVCKLWDDDPSKEIYHCDDCGICRIGAGIGKSHLHCKTCNVCMEMSHFHRHRCLEHSTECDCPICGEYLFTSLNGVVFMPCRHSIHRHCYSELMRATYRCPICSRSIPNMERQFLDLKREIELQPMPEKFRDTKAWIYCNDCLAKTKVKYHWLGLECAVCSSFNTVQVSLLTSRSRPPTPSRQANNVIDSRALPPAPQRRHSISWPQPRAAICLPSLNLFSRSLAFPPLAERRGRQSWHQPHSSDTALAGSPSASDPDDPADSLSGDAYSDVDFWGGESPRLFSQSPPGRIPNDTASEGDDESEGEDEEEDDEDEDDGQAHDEDKDEGADVLDQLEILGHR